MSSGLTAARASHRGQASLPAALRVVVDVDAIALVVDRLLGARLRRGFDDMTAGIARRARELHARPGQDTTPAARRDSTRSPS